MRDIKLTKKETETILSIASKMNCDADGDIIQLYVNILEGKVGICKSTLDEKIKEEKKTKLEIPLKKIGIDGELLTTGRALIGNDEKYEKIYIMLDFDFSYMYPYEIDITTAIDQLIERISYSKHTIDGCCDTSALFGMIGFDVAMDDFIIVYKYLCTCARCKLMKMCHIENTLKEDLELEKSQFSLKHMCNEKTLCRTNNKSYIKKEI